jgi:hypothetical protein
MARDKLTEYSATASDNTVCGDVNIAENSALPSDMNNFAREIMSHLKNFSDGTDAIDALTVTGDITNTNIKSAAATDTKVISGGNVSDNGANLVLYGGSHASTPNVALIRTGSTERCRIEGGSFMVGTTDSVPSNNGSGGDEGVALSTDGAIRAARSGNVSLDINRMDSDGDIAAFRKDGTTVGSIGAKGGDLIIGTGDVGIRFNDAGDALRPTDQSTGSGRDNAIDIGDSGNRFKDLYLSGGAYIGGTGAANKLDDYEEGTFTPVAEGETTAGSGTYNYQVGSYVKIGSLVLFQANMQFSSHTGSGVFRLSGLPFTAKNTTNLFAVAAAYLSGLPVASNHRAMPFVRPNTSYVNINQENGSGGASSVNIDAAAQVLITGSYRTDA